MRVFLGIVGGLVGLMIVTVLSTSWLVVYVHQKEEGWRLMVPAPVFLANIALRIGGAQAQQVDLPPEAREFLPMLRPIVDELGGACSRRRPPQDRRTRRSVARRRSYEARRRSSARPRRQRLDLVIARR